MKHNLTFVLKRGEAKVLQMVAGQTLKVECMDDMQLADLTFLGYSQGITLDNLRRLHLLEGDCLYNANEEPVMKVTKINSLSKTNILFPGCRSSVYLAKNQKKLGCRNLLAKEFGMPADKLPSTVNLFMDFEVDSETNEFVTVKPKVKRNDYNLFAILKDCVVGISACPAEFHTQEVPGKISVEVSE